MMFIHKFKKKISFKLHSEILNNMLQYYNKKTKNKSKSKSKKLSQIINKH